MPLSCACGHSLASHLQIVATFLEVGWPLYSLDTCEAAKLLVFGTEASVVSATTLSRYIPLVLQREEETIRQEMKGRHVAVIFDGMSQVAEIIAVVAR